MKTKIQADDTITLHYSPEAVWAVIFDIKNYPLWWPRSLNLKVLPIEGTGAVGATLRIKPSGGKEFFCRVESIEDSTQMVLRYFGGFISGRGEWLVKPDADGCKVSYRVDAEADGFLTALIGKFTDLGQIHSEMMEAVFLGLENRLHANANSEALSKNIKK